MTSSDVWYICDDFHHTTPHADVVVAWNEFADGVSRHISLPTILREEPSRYRDQLLDFFRQLETSSHNGQDLINSLRLHNDLSYWWMTLVFAKRWGGLGVLPNAVKTMALADLLNERRPRLLIVAVSDQSARQSIVSTARMLGIAHESKGAITSSVPRLAWIKAARLLITAFRPFRHRQRDVPHTTMIADYLFRVDPDALHAGAFISQYWAHLPNTLEGGVLWLHRFTPHPAIPTRRRARALIRRFNATANDARHVLLDDIHGLDDLRKTWRQYRAIRGLRQTNPHVAARFQTERADLWPIFKHDWTESFQGSHAMSMAILITSLESTIKSVTGAKRGLYIFENQPWEAPLVHAWKREHNVPLIAVPHSTIRFWDMRYFLSSDTHRDVRFGRPDVIAANSELARTELAAGGWPESCLHEVEALMYLYLGEPSPTSEQRTDIVVLGELDHSSTQRYLRFIESAVGATPRRASVVFKAHPLVGASKFNLDALDATVSNESVAQLLQRARVLVTGASGSTVLEALTRGVPTICVLDPNELDLSTIRQHPLLRLVGTANEFHTALDELLSVPLANSPMKSTFFHADARLERWHQLLRMVDSSQ